MRLLLYQWRGAGARSLLLTDSLLMVCVFSRGLFFHFLNIYHVERNTFTISLTFRRGRLVTVLASTLTCICRFFANRKHRMPLSPPLLSYVCRFRWGGRYERYECKGEQWSQRRNLVSEVQCDECCVRRGRIVTRRQEREEKTRNNHFEHGVKVAVHMGSSFSILTVISSHVGGRAPLEFVC